MPSNGSQHRTGPRICLIQPDRDIYSETFIRNHIERLPGEVTALCGGRFPTLYQDGRRFLPLPLLAFEKSRGKIALPAAVVGICESLKTRTLVSFLRRRKFDVVMAEYGTTGASVADACKRSGVPLVVHFHGFDAHENGVLEEYRSAYLRMFSSASALVAVSCEMREQLVRLGAPAEKVHHIPCGVDPSLFFGGTPGSSPPLFASVGRFVDKKAPYLTLLAFAKAAEQVPDARLVMVGEGVLLETTIRLAQSFGLGDRVDFRGVESPSYVASLLRGARALVQHSIKARNGDSEGTPVVILEAGATGIPVIATRHAGIKDVVRDGETGMLVEEGDVDGMAACIVRLAREPALAAALGAKAREHVSRTFSLEVTIGKLTDVLQNAAADKGKKF